MNQRLTKNLLLQYVVIYLIVFVMSGYASDECEIKQQIVDLHYQEILKYKEQVESFQSLLEQPMIAQDKQKVYEFLDQLYELSEQADSILHICDSLDDQISEEDSLWWKYQAGQSIVTKFIHGQGVLLSEALLES